MEDYNLQDFLNTENSMYNTELNPLLLEPDYFQFSKVPILDEPSLSAPSTFDWMTFVNEAINIHSASKVETRAVLNQASPITTLGQQPTAMELAAKRELAELLRAELQRLEADIA